MRLPSLASLMVNCMEVWSVSQLWYISKCNFHSFPWICTINYTVNKGNMLMKRALFIQTTCLYQISFVGFFSSYNSDLYTVFKTEQCNDFKFQSSATSIKTSLKKNKINFMIFFCWFLPFKSWKYLFMVSSIRESYLSKRLTIKVSYFIDKWKI